jgi:hypothetical protein
MIFPFTLGTFPILNVPFAPHAAPMPEPSDILLAVIFPLQIGKVSRIEVP